MTAAELIERYGLMPHPEGGWYREIHRSLCSVGVPVGYPGERSALTIIYFLLASGEFSAFHRVRGEEVWLYLAGGSLELVVLEDEPVSYTLGQAGEAGVPLVVVPPGALQAARTLGNFTLVTCLVAPGFDFADFVIPPREELLFGYPRHESLVLRFSRATAAP